MNQTIFYLYEFVLKLIRKNQSAGLSPIEFELHFNNAQKSYQDDLMGRFQARNNGKEGINTGLIENETILQKLSPFTKPIELDIKSGASVKPPDFIYRLALRINGYDCHKINQNQIATVNDSVIDPPSIDDNRYYFVEYNKEYSFLPSSLPTDTLTKCNLDYISTPPDVKLAYEFNENSRPVYNNGLSIQSLWDSNSNMEISKRILATLGVSFKDKDFQGFGKSVEITGE